MDKLADFICGILHELLTAKYHCIAKSNYKQA